MRYMWLDTLKDYKAPKEDHSRTNDTLIQKSMW